MFLVSEEAKYIGIMPVCLFALFSIRHFGQNFCFASGRGGGFLQMFMEDFSGKLMKRVYCVTIGIGAFLRVREQVYLVTKT